MPSRIRNFVQVFDHQIHDRLIDELMVEYNDPEKHKPYKVSIPDVAHYYTTLLESNVDSVNLLRAFVGTTYHTLMEYKAQLGHTTVDLWGNDFHSISELRLVPSNGFQIEMYDSRSDLTADRFVTALWFMNTSDFKLEFSQDVGLHPIRATKGTCVIFPSNWCFPYKFKADPNQDTYLMTTHFVWNQVPE